MWYHQGVQSAQTIRREYEASYRNPLARWRSIGPYSHRSTTKQEKNKDLVRAGSFFISLYFLRHVRGIWLWYDVTMENNEAQLALLEKKIDAVYASVEKSRKYLLTIVIVTLVTLVLPIILGAIALPMVMSTMTGMYQI